MKLFLKISSAIIFILIICYFIPYSTTQQTTIKASFLDISNEVNTPESWKNWYKPIKESYINNPSTYILKDDYKNHIFYITVKDIRYQVNSQSPASIDLITGNTFKTTQALRFFFDKKGKSIVEERYTTSLLNHLINIFKPGKEYNGIINSLKPFMETPELYYGFDIKRTSVPDTAYIILSKSVSKKEKYKIIDSSYSRLRKFAKKNKISIIGNPYLNFTNVKLDSIQIAAMLVVDKPLNNFDINHIIFFAMPKNANILTVHYHGPYGKSISVYEALEKYIAHHNLLGVFKPFERFNDNNIPKSDQSIVNMDVFYPIY
jgi:effector-binding domain-containing protein